MAMAEIILHTDIDCYVYIDTEFYGVIKANSELVSNFPIGAYWVECVSVECEKDKCNFDMRIDDTQHYQKEYNIFLKNVRYNRLIQGYDKVGEEKEGFIPVLKDGKSGYINSLGEYVFDYKYPSNNCIMIVVRDSKFGVVDVYGNIITDCQYDYISSFKNNIAKCIKDEKFGLITSLGDEIITPSYTWITSFNENGIAITQEGVKYGVINEDGKELLSPIYDEIVLSERYIYVYTNDKVGLYTFAGKCIITPKYVKIKEYSHSIHAYINEKSNDIEAENIIDIYNQNGDVLIYNLSLCYDTNYKELSPSIFGCKNSESWAIYKNGYYIDFGDKIINEVIPGSNDSLFMAIDNIWYYVELNMNTIINCINDISLVKDCFSLTQRFVLIDAGTKKYLYDCQLNHIILIEQFIVWPEWKKIKNDYLKSYNNSYIYGWDKGAIYFNEHDVRIIGKLNENIINIGGNYKCGEYDRDFGWQYYFDGGEWGWIKPDGTLSNVIYDKVEYLCKNKNLLRVSINKKVGVVDCNEITILPIEYDSISQIYYSSLRDNTKYKLQKKGKFAIANSLCRKITPLKYEAVCEYGGKMNGKWCVINDDGHEQSDFIYDYISSIDENCILVKNNNLYGIVGRNGQMILPLEYDKIHHIYGHELLEVKKNSRVGIINKEGEVILPIKYDEISVYKDAYIVVCDGKSILCDSDGRELFISKTEGIKHLLGGLFSVFSNGQYGIYSITENKFVLDCEYDNIYGGGDDIRASSKDWRITLDADANIIEKVNKNLLYRDYTIYDKHEQSYMEDPTELIFANKGGEESYGGIIGGLWGCVDKLGTLLLPYKYEYIEANNYYLNGNRFERYTQSFKLMKVGVNGKYGYINKNLREVIPVIYDSCFVASNNIVAVCLDGKWGYVDYENNIILEITYSDVSKFYGNIARVNINNKYGIINLDGIIIHPCKYDNISFHNFARKKDVYIPFSEINIGGSEEDDRKIRKFLGVNGEIYDLIIGDKYAKVDGKWSILKNFIPNTAFLYDAIYEDSEKDLVHCRIGNKHGIVDSNGEILIPFIYDKIKIKKSYSGFSSSIIVEKNNCARYIDHNGILGSIYKKFNDTYDYEDDVNYEKDSFIALGGHIEQYYEGCLDDYMDSIGL